MFVRTLSGKTLVLDAPPDDDVAALRESIAEAEGIPAHLQVLHHNGRALGHRGRFLRGDGAVVVGLALRGGGRGRSNHKGRRRQFTAGPEEVDPDKAAAQAKWNAKHGVADEGEDDIDEEDEDEEDAGAAKAKPIKPLKPVKLDQYGIPITDSEDSEEEEEEEDGAAAAAAAAPPLTRREREEIEKQEAQRKYDKLHAAGKTDEAMADLARLKLVREQREEAKKKREALEAAKKAAGKK